MLTLYYTLGACSMAAHIVLEESGEEYEAKKVDLAGGEQRTEAYLKINPLGRVPALLLDNGEPLAENTAILPFLGKRFNLWPEDVLAEAKALFLREQCACGIRPCQPTRALRIRFNCLPHAQRHRPQGFSRLRETDRRHASGTRMVLRSLHRARSLWFRLLHVGFAPPAPDGRAHELHGI